MDRWTFEQSGAAVCNVNKNLGSTNFEEPEVILYFLFFKEENRVDGG